MANQTWVRIYTEITRDRKIRRLPPAQRWVWIALLCMAKESPVQGKLLLAENVPVNVDDIVDEAGVDKDDVEAALEAFEKQGMIEYDENGVIVIKNWHKRQYQADSSTERVRRYRERKKALQNDECNVTCNVSETFQKRPQIQSTDTDIYTDTDTDIKKTYLHIRGNLSTMADELVNVFSNIEGVDYDYISDPIFFEELLKEYSYNDILHALGALKRKVETEKVRDPRAYIVATLERMKEKQKPPAAPEAALPDIDDETFDHILAKVSGLSIEEVRRL